VKKCVVFICKKERNRKPSIMPYTCLNILRSRTLYTLYLTGLLSLLVSVEVVECVTQGQGWIGSPFTPNWSCLVIWWCDNPVTIMAPINTCYWV